MLKRAILYILSMVTLASAQSQVPPLRLKIVRNNLSPNDSVIISWELPPTPVESFSVEWEGVTNGVGAEMAVPLVPGKTDRYSIVLSPLVRGQEYSVEVTALLAPPLRLSELKNFIFATASLVDVDIFGVTSSTMGLNVTALEPLSANDELRVSVRGAGSVITNINITTVGSFGRSRLLRLTLPESIIQVPSKTYQITVESLWLGSAGSAVTAWVTVEKVAAAPDSVKVTGLTPYVMELDVTLINPIDYRLNFSLIVDVFDMNGELYSIKNGAIQSVGDRNQTLRIFFNQALPFNQSYVIRLKTEYDGVESFWFSDLQTIFLHPTTTAIGEVVRNTINSFNVTLLFGTEIAPAYRLSWESQDNKYAGNATFTNFQSLRALLLTVSGLSPGQTYGVSIEALSGPLVIKGLTQLVTLAPAKPVFLGFDRNELAVNDSAVLKWRFGEGKTDSVTVILGGPGLTNYEVQQAGVASKELSEYTTVVPDLIMGNNYLGNLTAVVGDGVLSEPAQFEFTFAPNAPTGASFIGLTPLQAELNITQFDDVSPYPLTFTLQDSEGTVYPPQNGTLLSSKGRNRHLRLFFNTPLTPNRSYVVGVQSAYNGETSLPVYTGNPLMLDAQTPTLIDVQAVGDDKALLLWLPGSSIPSEYTVEWISLNSSESGTQRFVPPSQYTDGTLNATVVNLTSSHTYVFNVRPMGSEDRTNNLPFVLTMPPAYPRDVRIFPTPTSPKDSFMVAWLAGRGSIDYFNVTVAGSDGIFEQRSLPHLPDQSQYNITLSPITPNATYIANVYTVTGDIISDPVSFEFANVPSAPMSVSVTGIAQYSMDLSMTLLESSSVVDTLQVDVRDEQGRAYPPQNISITSRGGDQRTFRLIYDPSGPGLPLGRQYRVTVRTESEGTVSSPVTNASPISIDPLTPSLVGVLSDGEDTPERSSAVLNIIPSSEPMDGILIEWFSTDGSEMGNITYIPNPRDTVMRVSLNRLTPGQMYIIRVTAQGPSGVSRPLESYLALNPLSPYDLSVIKDIASADNTLLLSWVSVGGKVDYFDITVIGSDDSQQTLVYRPTASDPVLGPFTLPLPNLNTGITYEVRIRSAVTDGLKSSPAAIVFTQAPSAPTEVRLQKIGQTSAELEVTLLDETAQNPLVEVQLVDDQGQVYQASDSVEWEGSGQTRLLRVNFPRIILPNDRNYTASVRTFTNGNWTQSVSTTDETFLDPLTPSVLGIRTSEEGDNITATMGLLGSPSAEKYRVEWFSKDGQEYGNLEHIVNTSTSVQSINIPIPGLNSGQSYVFGVQAYGSNRTAVALDFHITLDPSVPISLHVERNMTSPNEVIYLSWSSGGGRVDRYNINIRGSDLSALNTEYQPSSPVETGPFNFILPPLIRGQSYVISVHSVSERARSQPAIKTFRYVDTDPTEVRLLGMSPYKAELGVTLLGNTSQTPDIEVNLRDGEDRDLFLTSNQTVWRGSGRDRVVQVTLSDRPLRANRDYRVAVRTMFNGTWSEPLPSDNQLNLDQLTPSMAGIQLTPDQDTPRLGTSTSAVVLVQPGEALVESYAVEWMATGSSDTWNTTYTPTANEAYRPVQIPITGLLPGQEYTFIALANQENQTATSLQYFYTQAPAVPQSVRIERDLLSPDESLFLYWKSGGGRADHYDITVSGGGIDLTEQYMPTPADGAEYKIFLPPLSLGEVYSISITSVTGQYKSIPALKQFRYVSSEPTEATILSMTPYSAEVGISLLGNTTENPEIEVLLLDNNGQYLFVSGNQTVWRGSGRDRVAQVTLSDRPLRANRDYRVAVRTMFNGTWSEPLSSENAVRLDPLIPYIRSISLTPDESSPQTGSSSTATASVQPGEDIVIEYLLKWYLHSGGNTSTWNTTYTPTSEEAYQRVNIPVEGLVPGETYIFTATSVGTNRSSSGLQYLYTQDPRRPSSVKIIENVTSPDGDLVLMWNSGGGKADYYEINVIGGTGTNFNTRYYPSDLGPYMLQLPSLTPAASYGYSVQSGSKDKESIPVIQQFRYVDTDPTEVRLLGMSPYKAELGVTLLGNTSQTPDIEVNLRDGQDRDLFLNSNQTVWRGSGRDRVVQVTLSDRPLRANRDYRVAVRTRFDGRWNNPLSSQNYIKLDPLTPSIGEVRLLPDENSTRSGTSTIGVVEVRPGEDPVDRYIVDWVSRDASNSGSTSFTPVEVYQPSAIIVTGLIPGQQYDFTVTAFQGDRNATSLNYTFTLVPASPQYVKVEPHQDYNNNSLMLSWMSGGGRTDMYRLQINSSEGLIFDEDYVPLPDHNLMNPYKIMLPQTFPGENYVITVTSTLKDGLTSYPTVMKFTSLPTAPTEVNLKQMTQYGGELEVTLLGNSTVTPDLEVTLRDSDGSTIITSNQTEWEGSGRQRLVRVKFTETPLAANQSYSVSVRTKNNGTWTEPVASQDPMILDPYTPAIMETETGLDNRSSPAGSYTLVWRPGQSPAQQYLIEWRTQDGTESRNTTFTPTTVNQDGSISYTFDTLTPGQQYEFKVTAINQGQMSSGIVTVVAQRPEAPRYVRVEPHPDYTNNSLRLSWLPGEGRYLGYRVTLQGSDGQTMQQDYVPLKDHPTREPYSVMLPPLTPGANYIASVVTMVDENILSNPAEISFTSLPTAPTEVKLKQMTQYGGELEVTLLGNSTVTPDLEVTLRDSDGSTIITSNQTEWEGSGRQRLVRVKFTETPLAANQSYSVSVRTKNNGTWTEPVASQDPMILDPYTPAIMETETGLDNRSSPTGSYTLVWRPGQSPAQQYLIEWRTQDGTESRNTTFTPTTLNQDGSISYTFDTLTPGQNYEFKVTAINKGQRSPGIANRVTLVPFAPQDLAVEPSGNVGDIMLSWHPGGSGRVYRFDVQLLDEQGEIFRTSTTPNNPDMTEGTKFSIVLPRLQDGRQYTAVVTSVVSDTAQSDGSPISFTYSKSAPSQAETGKIFQDAFEMNVTLLGDTTELPVVEIQLTDENGNVYPPINGTVIQKSGLSQLVRFPFNESNLPENRTYKAEVRTLSNGVWSLPILTRVPLYVDPLAPALLSVQLFESEPGTRTGVLNWEGGAIVPDSLILSYVSLDGSEFEDILLPVSQSEQIGRTTISPLTPGQTYTFMIRAIKGNVTSFGSNITISAIPSNPISIKIKPSDSSPVDTVELWWEDGPGVVDFHRISVEGPEGVVYHGDLPVPDTPTSLMNVSLWPMVRGNRYLIKLWSAVNKDVLSAPVNVVFTFASTAPTSVNLQKVSAYSAEVDVEMFDIIKSEVTQNINITLMDGEGNTYRPDRTLEWKREGRHSHIRLWFDSQLPSDLTYTASVTSLVNGTWTDPVNTTAPKILDPLQPTIIGVERAGEGSATVIWRTGATPSNTYNVEARSRRNGQLETVESTLPVPGQDGSTTFVNLNPGHEYIFTVTGISRLQTATSFPYPYTLDPVSPSNLRVGYLESSPNDSVVLMWDINDGEVDFFRLTWSSIEGNMNYTEDIPVNNTIIQEYTTFSHNLSPLEAGQTYRILLQTVSSARPGRFVEKIFTFAPSAPSSIALKGASPFEVGLNVSLFDAAWDNITIRTVITDENNNIYPTGEAVIWQKDGRHALTLVPLNRSRLPGDQNYTVTVQTQYNGAWSYPASVPIYLDPITPAIRGVKKDEVHPESMATVTWLPGSNDTELFNLNIISRDKADSRDYTVFMNIGDGVENLMNYTVTNLTAGQYYTVQLTAVRGADQASGLNYSVQMNPSAPRDVVVDRSDSSPNDSAVLYWGKGDGLVDFFNLRWGEYNAADETVSPSTVQQDVVPADGLEFISLLRPLEAGATYQVSAEAVSGGVPGEAKDITFTFAPSAPTNVEVKGITPNSIGLNVTLFDSAWENNSLNVEVMDGNNVSYPTGVVIWNPEGRSSLVRVYINDTRLPADQSFTVKLQSMHDNVWSFPYYTASISLDPLTPSMSSVVVNPSSPDTSFTVEWLPGLIHNNQFLLELFSTDGSEYLPQFVYTDIRDVNIPLNFTFEDLTPGQRYVVQLTSVTPNQTATALNYTIQLLPSSPIDVLLSPSTESVNDSAVLHWKYGAGKLDGFKVTVTELGSDNLIQSAMISPRITLPNSLSSYSQIISPLMSGKTYSLTLDTVSGSKMGVPSTRIFTFGSTAPSSITVDSVSPYGVDLNVTVFGEMSENIPLYINMTNTENVSFLPTDVRVLEAMGNTGIVRVNFQNTRLRPEEEYTLNMQTGVNNGWSYPLNSKILLDHLTPAVMDVRPDETAPETMIYVEFMPGSVDTEVFTVSLSSLDKKEYHRGALTPVLLDVNTPLQYRFVDLTPGQRYQVLVTAENTNGTSSSRPWNVVTHPLPPSDVQVTPWIVSSGDSVALQWHYAGDKNISFLIGWSTLGSNTPANITKISWTGIPGEKMRRHTFQLSPLRPGETYVTTIQSMVDNTMGNPVQRVFTFSPTAPTEVQVAAITPSSILLNVSLLEEAWENVTIRANLTDSEGNQYPTEEAVIKDQSGRRALVQISPQTDRLRSGRNYTIRVQTMYNNTWSFPMTTVTSLNSLTPTIIKVERDMMSPDSAFTVTWLPGQNGTQEFILQVFADDGSEYFNYSTVVDVVDFTKELNYSFVDLSPGQQYVIQLTARDNNKTATALNSTLQMYPSQPINVRIDRSDILPNQSAVLLWEYKEGLHDLFRITWSPLNRMDEMNTTEDILPNFTHNRKQMGYRYELSPLMEDKTYHVRLEAIVNDQASDPIEKFFTFAPTTATQLKLRGITPYSIGMILSLFDEAAKNITIKAVVEDVEGNLYHPDNVTVLRTDGRNALTRIMFEKDRLPAGKNYTVSVQTLSNGTWSYPITSTISLDSLTPAIVDIEPNPVSPSTAFSVVWVAGSNDTDSFIVTLNSIDDTETRNITIDVLDRGIDALQNYTFTDLTPGQTYVVKVTAIMGNKTASTLNTTVHMYPATPTNVQVRTSIQNTDELEFTWQADGIVRQFVLEGVSVNDPGVTFIAPTDGLNPINGTYNYTVSSLVRGEVYSVRVKAVNGDYSSASPFTTKALYPGKPFDLQLMRYDPSPLDSLTFTWRPRGGRVDYFLIRVMLSRGRGLVKEYREVPQNSVPYGLVLGPLSQGERYEVTASAVVGDLLSPVAKASSSVGPSVNILGLTPASIDLELDLFGITYDDMNVTVNVSDASGTVYTPVVQENLTEYSEQGRQIIRLRFMDKLPPNRDYNVTTTILSRGTAMVSLNSEPAFLDGRTPHILSVMHNPSAPNTSLSVYWLPGTAMADRYKVKWSVLNSPDVTEIDVKPSPTDFLSASITGLTPGELYRVTVEAVSADGTMSSSLPQYQRLVPALPVDVIVMRSEIEPKFTIQWARGDGLVTCYNTTIWPQPSQTPEVLPVCVPAPGTGDRSEISYNRLLPGETYWSGINSVQEGLQSQKVWTPVTLYPPGLEITGMKEDPTRGLIVTWAAVAEGKVDSVELTWSDLDGTDSGSSLFRPSELRGEIQGLLPGVSYIVGVNSQVLDATENIVQTYGETQVFVTEPTPPEAATFESTKDGVQVNVKQGEGLADSYLLQWQSDQQRSGETRLSVEQAQNLNNSIPLPPGARYIFTVKSIAEGKESQAMTETVVTAPESPRNLALSLGDDPSRVVNLRWDPPLSYVQAYHISWEPQASDNTSELHVNSSRSTSASVANLMPGRTYNFSVNALAWDSPSEPIVSTIHLAPSAPRIVYAEPAANTSIEVAWVFGEGSNDAAYIYIDDGFTKKETVIPNRASSRNSKAVNYYRVERLKEGLLYGVSMATRSMGIVGEHSPATSVTIPLEGNVPSVDVKTTSRSATLTWNFPESSMPPAPLPIPEKYRIRVIAPSLENNTACIKEVLIGFCRDCVPQSQAESSSMSSKAPLACAMTVRENLPVDTQVTYNVTDLNPYSTYKLLWYQEGGSGMVIAANTSIEAPAYVPPPVVTLIDDVMMEVCVGAPEPYPGPTEYILHVHDNQPGSSGQSLLNLTLLDADLVDGQSIQCVNITGQPFWSYKFGVTASTELGSLHSNNSFFQTPETAPGPVQHLEVQRIPYNYSAVRLVWDYPRADQMGGNITGFVIRYWRENPLINATGQNSTMMNETEMLSESVVRKLSGLSFVDDQLVTDLPVKPDYNYNIQVLPMTASGLVGNSSRNVTFATEIGPPPTPIESYPPVITQVTDQDAPNQITVSINPQFFMDNSHGEITEYGLIVQDSTQEKVTANNGIETQYYRTFPNWNEGRTQRRAYRTTPTDWKLDASASQVVYTIGADGQCTGQTVQYCNGQLDPSKQYSIKGFACTAAGCSETKFYNGFMVASQDGVCVRTANGSTHPYSDLEMALIIVVVILILFLIVLIVLVLILHLRKQKQKEGHLLKGELNDGHDTMVRGQHMGLTKM